FGVREPRSRFGGRSRAAPTICPQPCCGRKRRKHGLRTPNCSAPYGQGECALKIWRGGAGPGVATAGGGKETIPVHDLGAHRGRNSRRGRFAPRGGEVTNSVGLDLLCFRAGRPRSTCSS